MNQPYLFAIDLYAKNLLNNDSMVKLNDITFDLNQNKSSLVKSNNELNQINLELLKNFDRKIQLNPMLQNKSWNMFLFTNQLEFPKKIVIHLDDELLELN